MDKLLILLRNHGVPPLVTQSLHGLNHLLGHGKGNWPLHGPDENPRLSAEQLEQANDICRWAVQMAEQRDGYVREHGLDSEFALPDANWSQEAPNEYQRLFVRVGRCDEEDIRYLRAFCHCFSGYTLYAVRGGRGAEMSRFSLTPEAFEAVRRDLGAWNHLFVNEWLRITRDLPPRYRFNPPPMLGECGHVVDGVLVNHDSWTYQERINILYRSGVLDWLDSRLAENGRVRILEIGGGYGAMAGWFRQAFPSCDYTIVDLPESLMFSGVYLAVSGLGSPVELGLKPARQGVTLVPNFMAEQLDGEFDLAINTLSFSEMSQHQVERYGMLIRDRYLAQGGILFEQNQDNRHMGLVWAEEILKDLFVHRISFAGDGRKYKNGTPNLWSGTEMHLPFRE